MVSDLFKQAPLNSGMRRNCRGEAGEHRQPLTQNESVATSFVHQLQTVLSHGNICGL